MTRETAQAAVDEAEAQLTRLRARLASTVGERAETDAALEAATADRSRCLQREAAGEPVSRELAAIRKRLGEARGRLEELDELQGLLTEQCQTAERDHAQAQEALQRAQGEELLGKARQQAARCNELAAEYSAELTALWALSVDARRLLGLNDGRPMWENRYAQALSPHLMEARTLTVRMPLVVIGE